MKKTLDLERFLVSISLALVFASALFDYIEDFSEGATYIDFLFDTCLNLFVIGTLLYIWKKRPNATRSHNQKLEKVLKRSGEDLKRWQEKASSILRGLGEKIDEQLDEWCLSAAEKEIALMLWKKLRLPWVLLMVLSDNWRLHSVRLRRNLVQPNRTAIPNLHESITRSIYGPNYPNKTSTFNFR